jgi:hypothetical protein
MVRENEVVSFGRLLAGEARFMRLPARVPQPPVAAYFAERQERSPSIASPARRWRLMKDFLPDASAHTIRENPDMHNQVSGRAYQVRNSARSARLSQGPAVGIAARSAV